MCSLCVPFEFVTKKDGIDVQYVWWKHRLKELKIQLKILVNWNLLLLNDLVLFCENFLVYFLHWWINYEFLDEGANSTVGAIIKTAKDAGEFPVFFRDLNFLIFRDLIFISKTYVYTGK